MTSPATGLWLTRDTLAFRTGQLNAEDHAHTALQVLWPDPAAPARLNGRKVTGPTVIASGARHSVSMAAGWILLVEAQSTLGEALARSLAGSDRGPLPGAGRDPEPSEPDSPESVQGVWQQVRHRLGAAPGTHPLDSRVEAVVARLNSARTDLAEPGWRLAEVAATVGLSESRFLHLFRAHMGVAWRPYLRWKRLLRAVEALRRGCSATEAAHNAGFTDSAHLSHTFRATFGLTIRDARALAPRSSDSAGLYKR